VLELTLRVTTRRSRTERLYSADLAHIHDAGFGDLAKRAGPEVVRILRAHRIRNGLIVEAGCGSGILAAHLVDAGYDVSGFDQSAAMIRLARARAPAARFRVMSLTRAILPACRAVVAIGEVITYVPSGVGTFFRRVHAALDPGGLFIFDFIESGKRRIYPARIIEGDGWSLVARADLSASGRILTRRLIAKRMIGKIRRRTREIHRVRIYSREEIWRALAAAGFSARMSRSYGRYRLMPGDVAVIARKSYNSLP
jgi:SAM-dependent methyltransferase